MRENELAWFWKKIKVLEKKLQPDIKYNGNCEWHSPVKPEPLTGNFGVKVADQTFKPRGGPPIPVVNSLINRKDLTNDAYFSPTVNQKFENWKISMN